MDIPLDELHFQMWVDNWRDSTSPYDMAKVWIDNRTMTSPQSFSTFERF
jgi:hypothetical protein